VRKAIIAGASGLIGGLLLEYLLQSSDYKDVIVLVRKELPIKHQKLKQIVVDFDKLEDYLVHIAGDVLFCCLGTTRKKTPDLSVYRKIDHDYPVALAHITLKNQVTQYHLVSAMGANAGSASFYNKIKGETERDVTAIGVKCLQIYRPSLLTGDRKEGRFAERLAIGIFKFIDPLLIGSLKKYRSIPAKTVAQAMYKQSLLKKEGVFIHLSDQIKQLS
jgi:uncharacterized protein YbjT (DUF2867 family)